MPSLWLHGTFNKVIWPFILWFPFLSSFIELFFLYCFSCFLMQVVSGFCCFISLNLLANSFITWIFKLWNDGAQIIQFCRRCFRYFICLFTFIQIFRFPCFLGCFPCLRCLSFSCFVNILIFVFCKIFCCCIKYFTTSHFFNLKAGISAKTNIP